MVKMRFYACATLDSEGEEEEELLDDEETKRTAPRWLVARSARLQTTVEVARCRFGTSRQVGDEDVVVDKDAAPIVRAVYHGREAALQHFLLAGVSPDTESGLGVPLLCVAVACGHFGIAKMLLEAGAAVDARTEREGETALHKAVKGSWHDIVDLLLMHRVELDVETSHTGETALHYAAGIPGSLALVTKLLNLGADYEMKNVHGQTPAVLALQAGDIQAAVAIVSMARGKRSQLVKEKEMLLQHAETMKNSSSMTNDIVADIFTATCDPDSTVLIEVIKKNDAALVEMFLERGEDPRRANAQGLLPVFVAVKFANLRIIKLLVLHGAQITENGPGNLGLLQVLFKTSSARSEATVVAIAEYLVFKGADGSALYPDGKSLLHQVINARLGYAGVVKLLLQEGADINTRDSHGNTVLHLAAINGSAITIHLLLKARADSTVVNLKKQTPLFCAVQHRQWAVVPFLAIPPAITSWNAEGSTALHQICQSLPQDSTTWVDIAAATKPFYERAICRSMRDRSGATPLILAIQTLPEEGLPVVEALLVQGGETRNCVGHEDHEGRDALYYAAHLGKPIFVEALLNHGAPIVLANWTDEKRLKKLPATTTLRILELITESSRWRQVHGNQEQSTINGENCIEKATTEQRSSSAMSGYHADWETDREPKSSRHNIRKTTSLQQLHTPVLRQRSVNLHPSFPARSSSIQQDHRTVLPSAQNAVLSTPLNNKMDREIVRRSNSNSQGRCVKPFEWNTEKTLFTSGSPGFTTSCAARSTRNQLPRTLSTRRVHFDAPILEVTLPDDTLPISPSQDISTDPTCAAARLNIDSPASTPNADSSTVEASKVLTDDSSELMEFPQHHQVPEPAEPSIETESALLSESSADLQRVDTMLSQPARVDSGVSFKQEDRSVTALPTPEKSKSGLGGRATETKRQSGDELASWLAISSMLDRL